MYRFVVSLDLLRRAACFVSTEETRYYLNGVAIDFSVEA